MARGKKFNDDIKESVRAVMATTNNVMEVSRQFNIPVRTLYDWQREWESEDCEDNFTKLRKENKERFIKQAGDIIEKATALLDKKVSRALDNEKEIDKIISTVIDDDEMSKEKKKEILGKLSQMKLEDVQKLSIMIGTMYDKRALAKGDATEIQDVKIVVDIEE